MFAGIEIVIGYNGSRVYPYDVSAISLVQLRVVSDKTSSHK